MIIAISGKINSGKDTVAKIIQILESSPHFTNEAVLKYLNRPVLGSAYEIQKFADALKQCVCLFLGCTMEQLEDREFKEKELGEEWWYYKTPSKSLIPYLDKNQPDFIKKYDLVKPTPRSFMQLLGTECGRQILHPNIWCNSLMSEYKNIPITLSNSKFPHTGVTCTQCNKSTKDLTYFLCEECINISKNNFPNWIITDMRFPNELEAVKKRDGITIRVNRAYWKYQELKDNYHMFISIDGVERKGIDSHMYPTEQKARQVLLTPEIKEHESETVLDNAKFNYTINNDGTLLELVAKVRQILIEQKILKNE